MTADQVEAIKRDWRCAGLDRTQAALADFAERLTRRPQAMAEADALALRKAGLSDADIADAVLVTAYFNFVNRIAQGLGVELE